MAVGLLSFAAPLSVFNGGIVQSNLNFLNGSNEFPFMNVMKNSGFWNFISTNTIVPPSTLASDGYPSALGSLPNGGVYTTAIIPSQVVRAGNWVIAWDGDGTIYAPSGSAATFAVSAITAATNAVITVPANSLAIGQTLVGSGITNGSGSGWTAAFNTTVRVTAINVGADPTKVAISADTSAATGTPGGTPILTASKSNSSSTAGGRYVLSSPSTTITMGIVSNGTVRITNMRVCHIDDEATMNTNIARGKSWGGFGTKFLQRMREANYGVVRFLNWQNCNFENVSTWDTRKPVNYPYFEGDEMRPSLQASSVATSNGQDFTATLGSGAPADRATVHVMFTGAAISSITQVAGVATVTTTAPHGLNSATTSYLANITGASPAGYNVNAAAITVTGASTFTYTVSSGLASPATGTPVYSILNTSTVTLSGGNGNDITVNWTNNGLADGDPVGLQASGFLPTSSTNNLSAGTPLFVVSAAANSFKVALTLGGAPIVQSIAGSGTFTCVRSPTLNLNSSGAVPLRNGYAFLLDSTTNLRTASISTLVYESSLGVFMKFGTNNTSYGIRNGVPVEICLQLCIELGAHPYFVTPFLACDPITDWLPSAATYVRANSPAWMIPRFEGPNEEWNFAFNAANYASVKGDHYGWGHTQIHEWMGLVMSNLGQAALAAYGGSGLGSRFKAVCGIQSVTSASSGAIAVNNPRLVAAKYVAGAPLPPAGYVADAAYKYVSSIAMANYMSPAGNKTNASALQAFNWFLGNSPSTQVDSYVDTLLTTTTGNLRGTLSDLTVWYANARTWQQSYRTGGPTTDGVVDDLFGYEGASLSYAAIIVPPSGTSTTYNVNSAITAISNANPCQVTVGSTTFVPAGSGSGQTNANASDPAPLVAGMFVALSGLTGSYAGFNFASNGGISYEILSVVDAANGIFTINLDATSAAGSSTGTAIYCGDATASVANASGTILNAFLADSDGCRSSANMQGYTYGGTYVVGGIGTIHGNIQNFIDAGGEYPSQYLLAGPGSIWAVFDSVFDAGTPPIWAGLVDAGN